MLEGFRRLASSSLCSELVLGHFKSIFGCLNQITCNVHLENKLGGWEEPPFLVNTCICTKKRNQQFVCILLQLKEKCAASLGLFFIGDTKCPYKELILQSLLSLKEKNHIDLQFSVGESLSCLAAGKLCDSAEDPWNYEKAIASPVVMTTGDDDMMEIILKTVVGEYAFSTAPVVRQVIINII